MMIEGILYGSEVSGPGKRNVLITRGCPHKCPGCINEGLWSFTKTKHTWTTEDTLEIVNKLLEFPCDGVTITGGEPLYWFNSGISHLLLELKQRGVPVIIFTGYTLQEITSSTQLSGVLSLCAVIITGRFEESHVITTGLRGSSNQEIVVLSGRYSKEQLENYPQAMEVHLDPVVIAGFPSEGIPAILDYVRE